MTTAIERHHCLISSLRLNESNLKQLKRHVDTCERWCYCCRSHQNSFSFPALTVRVEGTDEGSNWFVFASLENTIATFTSLCLLAVMCKCLCVGKIMQIAHFLFVFSEGCQVWRLRHDEASSWICVLISNIYNGNGSHQCVFCRRDRQQVLHVSPLLWSPLVAQYKSAEACSFLLKPWK